MKRIYTFFAMATMAMTIFTSCERLNEAEDRHEARTLDGTWTGYIDTYYTDRWGLTGDNYRTTMYFERDNAYGGWGYEVDYDVNSRYSDYYYCEFEWEVFNGTIRISYADSWNDVYIRDYCLDDYYFDGYMDDGTTKDIRFRLTYDNRFDGSPWHRTATRGAANDSKVKASGIFANTEK